MAIIHSLYREAGEVRIDESTCNRCGRCVRICPAEVLSLKEGRLQVNGDTPFGCIACGHCMMVCPHESIRVTGRGLSPEDLRPLPPPGTQATPDALGALMTARRSVRHFRETAVELPLIERIVEMAAAAPMGIPPWDVGCVIVQGRDRVREVTTGVIRQYEGFLKLLRPWVMTLLRPFMKQAMHEQFRSFILPLARTYVEHYRQGRDVVFYDAPALLVFHHSPYAETADAIIPCTYAMLAAEAMGLGTTMIGGAAPALQRDRALCRRMGIPEGNKPSIALILGYPAVNFERTLHRRFSSVTRF